LRFKSYEDTSNILQIDGESIIYRYSSTTAEMRNLNSAEGVFKPRYFSVHIPPEHVLPNHAEDEAAMEVQYFHSASDGSFAVVVFFFKAGAHNDFLSFLDPSVITAGSTTAEDVPIVGVEQFLTDMQDAFEDSYYYYKGSLTQPPCAEKVQWHLIDTVWEAGQNQIDDLAATLQRAVSAGGNARDSQRTVDSVLYYDAKANAISDPVCGGGKANWNDNPYDCTDQFDGHNTCFYCSGRSRGFEARNMCFNRMGRGCNELFNTPEALTYCNLAFECPASTFSSPVLVLGFLVLLMALKNFW